MPDDKASATQGDATSGNPRVVEVVDAVSWDDDGFSRKSIDVSCGGRQNTDLEVRDGS